LSSDEARIAHAAHLARLFDAHLRALVQNLLIQLPFAFNGIVGASIPEGTLDEAEAHARQLIDRTRRQLALTGLRHDVERIDAFLGGMISAMARRARTSDLFVSTLPGNTDSDAQDLAEAVLFGSGRACFFAPRAGVPPDAYDHVLVAWKDSLESARALAEALPFLHRAKDITVVIVEEGGAAEASGQDIAADIGRYLSKHRLNVEIRKTAGWESVSEALVSEARNVQADLLVLGGYGHSRFRQWVMGGVTRDLLRSSTIPLLMAH
jgi:nucleotide-binding universal stress UspA family protein